MADSIESDSRRQKRLCGIRQTQKKRGGGYRKPLIMEGWTTLWPMKSGTVGLTQNLSGGTAYVKQTLTHFLQIIRNNLKTKTYKHKQGLFIVVTFDCSVIVLGMRDCSSSLPDWRAPLSPAKRNKQTKKTQQQKQQNCMCLRGFLDMSPFFVFWKDIFTWRFGPTVPRLHHLILVSFLTGSRCSFLLATSTPTSLLPWR